MATTTRPSVPRIDDLPRPAVAGGLIVGAALTAAALVEAFALLGPVVAAVPVVIFAGWHLVRRPDHGLLLLVFTTVAFEDDSDGLLAQTDLWFRFLPGLPVQPLDLVIVAIVAGLALRFVQNREAPRWHAWVVLPIPILLAALASGTVTGYLAGGDLNALLNSFRVFALLALVPLISSVAIDRYEMVDRVLKLWFVVAAAKCAYGALAWFAGQGAGSEFVRLTYYTPTMNQYALLVVLGVLALAWRYGRAAMTKWVALAGVSALLSLVLALRRSFWIALVLGVLLTILIASGRRGRPWVVVGGALVLVAVTLTLSAGGATNSDNPVLQRAEIRDDAEDRYRLDEQANVAEEILRHPWTGLGLGVPWEARHPLSLEFDSGRNYTHVVVFFFWIKLGPLGVLGYAAVVIATTAYGVRLWRLERDHDRVIACAGLAIALAEVTRVVVELTGSFTGVNDRFTVAQMLVLGWASAATLRAEARARARDRDQFVGSVPDLPRADAAAGA